MVCCLFGSNRHDWKVRFEENGALEQRAHWGSRLGFILAAAGSAVGLGNIWKFPYITGENGGGAFVVVYLLCVSLVGLPVMVAEILIGRSTQSSPARAFRILAGAGSPWISMGWLGVACSFVVLSYYSVVAGWALHFTYLSLTGNLVNLAPAEFEPLFGSVYASAGLNLAWHSFFMGLTMAVVLGGVSKGVERWSRILMPALFVMMLILLAKAFTLDGFERAVDFMFGFRTDKLTGAGALEALGHAFFSLSLGMGAMLTYGSYLHKDDDIMGASITITALDTGVAIAASMILFPILFTQNMEAAQGPGLVFISIPMAFAQMTGGAYLAPIFFGLLVFAALTSAISMLEVTTSSCIDGMSWTRKKATLLAGGLIFLVGVPSALSGGTALFGSNIEALIGKNWFDSFDYLATNWMLPLGGLGIAVYTAWRMDEAIRHDHFLAGTKMRYFYKVWLLLLKFLVPVAIILIFLHAIGLL
jgi:NSS family neurotransmitter:Na+ symporter